MSGVVYKYFPSQLIEIVFAKDGMCGLKCSLPSEYNDPFELFLGVDLRLEAEEIAVYNEIVGKIDSELVTCFSRSPVVTPMWAHYGENHKGFVIGFDRKKLSALSSNIIINDVSYKDTPDNIIRQSVQMAAGTKKPRHAVRLAHTAFRESYFSKQSIWSYEAECRLVVSPSQTENVGGLNILYAPHDCITNVISGYNSSTSETNLASGIADRIGVVHFKSVIGKSTAVPFFVRHPMSVHVFDGTNIIEAEYTCDYCSEPIEEGREFCALCRVTSDDEIAAAQGNPLRLLDYHGILEDYLAIGARKKI